MSLTVASAIAPLEQSPLWSDLLDHVGAQISGAQQVKGSGPSSLRGTGIALARAHSRVLVALETGSNIAADAVSQLASEAVELVVSVARVWATFEPRAQDRRGMLVDLLRRRLGSHEDAVLAGEVTYRVWSEQAEQPAARTRRAIASLSRHAPPSDVDLLSLRTGAVDLASLLVRLAANAAASGRAGEAPEPGSSALEAKLRAVTAELAASAPDVGRPADDRAAGLVVHHLAAGLRVCVSRDTLHRPCGQRTSSTDQVAGTAGIDGLRDAWLRLAKHEFAAVTALDAHDHAPTSAERLGSLYSTLAERAGNVICGARLAGRPEAFRHAPAWGHQAVALTHALEAYIAGLRGHGPSLAQAHQITLTRLVRATVAIAVIDLAREQAFPSDRNPEPREKRPAEGDEHAP